MASGGSIVDFDTLKRLVFEVVGQRVIGIDQRNRGKCTLFAYRSIHPLTIMKMGFDE